MKIRKQLRIVHKWVNIIDFKQSNITDTRANRTYGEIEISLHKLVIPLQSTKDGTGHINLCF